MIVCHIHVHVVDTTRSSQGPKARRSVHLRLRAILRSWVYTQALQWLAEVCIIYLRVIQRLHVECRGFPNKVMCSTRARPKAQRAVWRSFGCSWAPDTTWSLCYKYAPIICTLVNSMELLIFVDITITDLSFKSFEWAISSNLSKSWNFNL